MYDTSEYQHFVRAFSLNLISTLAVLMGLSLGYLQLCTACLLPNQLRVLWPPSLFSGTVRTTKVYSLTGSHAWNNKHTVASAKYKPCPLSVCCHAVCLSQTHFLFLFFSHVCLAYLSLYLTVLWAGGAQGLVLKDKAAYFMFFFSPLQL